MSDAVEHQPALDVGSSREAIREEYAEVAAHPEKGFHSHTGRPLARMLDYNEEWLEGIPESFAGQATHSAWASCVRARAASPTSWDRAGGRRS
jgi:hypothetical protein